MRPLLYDLKLMGLVNFRAVPACMRTKRILDSSWYTHNSSVWKARQLGRC
jgi:hypothetical protein